MSFFDILAVWLSVLMLWLQSPEMPFQVLSFIAWVSLGIFLASIYALVICSLRGWCNYFRLERGAYVVGELLGFPVNFLLRHTAWFPNLCERIVEALKEHKRRAEFQDFFYSDPIHTPDVIESVETELGQRAEQLHGLALKIQALQRQPKTRNREERLYSLRSDFADNRPLFWNAHKLASDFGFAKADAHYTDYVDHSKFKTRPEQTA